MIKCLDDLGEGNLESRPLTRACLGETLGSTLQMLIFVDFQKARKAYLLKKNSVHRARIVVPRANSLQDELVVRPPQVGLQLRRLRTVQSTSKTRESAPCVTLGGQQLCRQLCPVPSSRGPFSAAELYRRI